MWRWILVIAAVGVLGLTLWGRWQRRPYDPGPGRVAPDEPEQMDVAAGPAAIPVDDYALTPLADFRIRARVLARRRYRLGREADLSPIDLALGWGPMSDSAVLAKLRISQGGRHYYWSTRGYKAPIPISEIERGSANMHLIPATPEAAKACKAARVGQVVEFSGSLVHVKAADGWRWQSSTTRADIGAGACELVYVRDFRVVPPTPAAPKH